MGYCCDAHYFVMGGKNIFREGIFHDYVYKGYRSYLNYVFSGFSFNLGEVFSFFFFDSPSYNSYAAGVLIIYLFISCALLRWLNQYFFILCLMLSVPFFPLFVNHFYLPLQEGMFFLLCWPLWILFICYRQKNNQANATHAVLIGLLIATLSLLKNYYVITAIALFFIYIYENIFSFKNYKQFANNIGIVLSITLLLWLPQLVSMYDAFGVLSLYPDRSIGELQLRFGIELFRYESISDPISNGFIGYRYETGLIVEKINDVSNALNERPLHLLFIWFSHLITVFNFDNLTTYIYDHNKNGISWGGFIPGIVISSYFVILFRSVSQRKDYYRHGELYIDCAVFLLWLPLAFVAPETRFGLPALALMILRLLQFGYFQSNIRMTVSHVSSRVGTQGILFVMFSGIFFVVFQTLVDDGFFVYKD